MDITRYVAEEAQGLGLGARDVLKTVEEKTQSLVNLGYEKGEQRFTTQEMLELEESLISLVKEGSLRELQVLSKETIQRTFSELPSLNAEQRNAVYHLTSKTGSVSVVSGMAGTGKSFMLKAVKQAFELSLIHISEPTRPY